MKQSKRNKIFKLKRAAALILAFVLAFIFYQAAGNVYITYAPS